MRNDARLVPAVNRTVRQINRRWATEPLECRRLFNNMEVFGTPFDDTCIIEMDANFIYATMNGVLVPQPIGSFSGVTVHLFDGDDVLEVRNVRNGMQVGCFEGNGADQVLVAPTTRDLDSIDGVVFGGGGADNVQDGVSIFDDADTGNDNYAVAPTGLAKVLTKAGVEKVKWHVDQARRGAIEQRNQTDSLHAAAPQPLDCGERGQAGPYDVGDNNNIARRSDQVATRR